jgi:hypothetical protein
MHHNVGRQNVFTLSHQSHQNVFTSGLQGRQNVFSSSRQGHPMVVKGSHMTEKNATVITCRQFGSVETSTWQSCLSCSRRLK